MALLRAENLTKRFPGGIVALDGLTLELEPGLVGLVGANGAGKSTFIKILLGLLRPDAGTVEVLGRDPTEEPIAVRERTGYLPEHDCLPSDESATDFVTHMAGISGLPRSDARERAAEMLRHVGLYEARYRTMDGYSTGMKQRVKLAQALVHDPDLLLLDEPTNGLDPAGREEMLDLIRRTGHDMGITVLVCSHLLGEIQRVCDHLVAIDSGRIVHSASIGSFTRETAVLTVEVDAGADRLARRLSEQGIEVEGDGPGVLRMPFDGERVYDLVRDAAADLELPLVRLQRRRHRLEDLFRSEAAGSGREGASAAAAAAVAATGEATGAEREPTRDGGEG